MQDDVEIIKAETAKALADMGIDETLTAKQYEYIVRVLVRQFSYYDDDKSYTAKEIKSVLAKNIAYAKENL
ncbi:hypothetical protein ACI2JA_19765 [Alkalihalobacillus sp. NPDC078783]|uniref:hypothetical protein n=1 Tax=Streptomyces albidoflavus TaxID=1886 RepID=UPI0033F3442E